MFPYDPSLRDVLLTPPQSIADVLQAMRAIDAICIDGDGLKWFNQLYLQVTQAVKSRIDAGGFADPEWMATLDVRFASLYFNALDLALSGQPCPDCWQTLFERRAQVLTARIQFALAGINAHINRDLPVALVATSQRSAVQYADYSALNTTLDSLIETAKKTLHVRLLGDALPPVSQLEDTLAAWSVCAAREAAWQNAEILWHLREVPAMSAKFLDSLDGLTSLASKALLVPVV